MTEQPADIDIDLDPSSSSPVFTPPPPSHNRPPVWVWAGVAVVLLALGAAYWFLWRESPQPVATRAPVQAPAPKGESGEQITLPPLDETDPIVRQLVQKLSSHPTVAAWLTTEGLLLNFVVVTTKVANGETPVIELKPLRPIPRFSTRTSGDNRYIDRSSYRRYDRFAEAVSALDARGTARLYATLKPRISEAYGRMGPSDGNFDAVLERAIFELLSVPVVEGEVALVPHGTVYGFAEPRLQEMSAAQKQFLRMGPQNVHTVQAKLREIAAYAGIPETRLPPAKPR
jgi:Protein of unknown function (DUF3014)